MRYFLELSYLGTHFHGWQRQNNATSVQQVLEESLSLLLKEDIAIIGCGRTDKGVHAKQFFAHIDNDIELEYPDKLGYKLNGLLSKDIAIHRTFSVHDDAHTRFDATSRSYEYHLNQRKNPFKQLTSYDFRQPLNVEAMNAAAVLLLETEEFGAFCKAGSENKTMFCNVTQAEWKVDGSDMVFHITADRFLRNMVRAVVGTLIEVGLGRITKEGFHEIIKSQNRNEAGPSAPAHGLYLTQIKYPYI